jgi:hypothetical protein
MVNVAIREGLRQFYVQQKNKLKAVTARKNVWSA